MLQGNINDRLLTLEQHAESVRLDLQYAIAGMQRNQNLSVYRLGRTRARSGESYPTDGSTNTFPFVFVDGHFEELEGNQSVTWYDRQPDAQNFVRQTFGAYLFEECVFPVFRVSGHWYTEWYPRQYTAKVVTADLVPNVAGPVELYHRPPGNSTTDATGVQVNALYEWMDDGSNFEVGSELEIYYSECEGLYRVSQGQCPSGSVVSEDTDFTQATPATTWTINHNRGAEPQDVTIFDLSGNKIFATVSNPTNNQTVITFGVAQSGRANLEF